MLIDAPEYPVAISLQVVQGATFRRGIAWKPGGVIADLAGYTARMQIRKSYAYRDYGNAPLLTLSTENGGIALGSQMMGSQAINIMLHATAAQTRLLPPQWLKYDIELTPPNGESIKLMYGPIQIIPEVTRAV